MINIYKARNVFVVVLIRYVFFFKIEVVKTLRYDKSIENIKEMGENACVKY